MQGGSDGSNPNTALNPSIQLYREVHKHAYLRHINNQHGKKSSGEQYWVVFCVHCDTVPYLEFYSTQATSVTHQPIWRMCLTGTTSVSGALVPQGKLYRLTLVTRESGITLAAFTWDDMKDWVDTLRAKLREMKILGPGENLYSKPPEQLVRNRAPTRDPTSPLPPPPPGPVVYVPGTEIPQRTQYNDETQAITLDAELRVEDSHNEPSNRNMQDFTSNEISPQGSEEFDRNIVESSRNESSSDTITHSNESSLISNITTGNTSMSQLPSSSSSVGIESSTIEGKKINRLHVGGMVDSNTMVSRIEVTSTSTSDNVSVVVSTPYEALQVGTPLAQRYENQASKRQNGLATTKITSENVSKMKDFTKVDNKLEPTTKVCKDGGLILYNKSLDTDQASFISSNPQQWDDLNTTLMDNLNNSGSTTDFTSAPTPSSSNRVANISGMNVCLVDSLLPPNRNTTSCSSDDDFETNEEISSVSPSTPQPTNIKRDSKGYTQVDVNSKKVEIFKNKLFLPFSTSHATTSQNVIVTSHSASTSNAASPIPNKPIPLPRTKMDGSTKPGVDETKHGGVYVSLTEFNTASTEDKVILRDHKDKKKSTLNRTSSVPDSIESEYILHTFCGKMVDGDSTLNHQSGESNVTIISVTQTEHNDTVTSVPSTAIPIIGRSFDFDFKQTPQVKEDTNKKYVNVSVTNIDSSNQDATVHLRQTSQSHLDSTSIKESQEHSDHKKEHKRTSLDSCDVFGKSKNAKSCKNSIEKTSKALEIPEFKQIKNVEGKVRSSTTHTRDFYESVFGPFSTDTPNNASNSCDRIVVGVPKLVVNIPNTSHSVQRNEQPSNSNANKKDTSESIKRSDNVFVKSRQIVNLNRDEDFNSSNMASASSARQGNSESEYEFLSWSNQNNNADLNLNMTRVILGSRGRQDNGETAQTFNHNVEQQREAGNDVNQSKTEPAGDNNVAKRSGLFTRGLTDLNIISKFRNLSVKTGPESKTPLLLAKTSNFYENTESSAIASCSRQPSSNSSDGASTSNTNPLRKNTADRTPFTAKLNNIFNKFTTDNRANSNSDGSALKNHTVENIMKSESSLRRNWSEHNDRTAPPNINIRARNHTSGKALRPHPPAIGGISPRRQLTSQSNDLDNRRRSNSLSDARVASDETNPSQTTSKPTHNVPMMSLREQQVMRLRNEMAHSGGIRLLLSSRDSPELAVALVDIYSGVWVAGWKQRSHPLLYNALHIGDRLHSVDGCIVSNARQARRAIQTNPGPKVEIIIKRLPHGRVYALKRDSDRQDLGLIMDSANITGIVPNSSAHRAGVPNSGTLTEVNGRPLNLLLKKGNTQVKDRLTSVGKEVSILVQPTEFVSLLRAALKAVRGCKDYIVQ